MDISIRQWIQELDVTQEVDSRIEKILDAGLPISHAKQ